VISALRLLSAVKEAGSRPYQPAAASDDQCHAEQHFPVDGHASHVEVQGSGVEMYIGR